MESYFYGDGPLSGPNPSTDILKLYYHHDRLGTTDYLSDNVAGDVRSYVTYDDWGALTAKAVLKCGVRELDLVQQYTVHPMDMALGVYFAQARMYDAQDRRFVSEDVIKGWVVAPKTLNDYSYCWNNPLLYIDFTGLVPTVTIGGNEVENIKEYNGSLYGDISLLFDAYDISGAYMKATYGDTASFFKMNFSIGFFNFGISLISTPSGKSYYMSGRELKIATKRVGHPLYHHGPGMNIPNDTSYINIDYFQKIMCELGLVKPYRVDNITPNMKLWLIRRWVRENNKNDGGCFSFAGNYNDCFCSNSILQK
jgi:RHS repeat-associated protein